MTVARRLKPSQATALWHGKACRVRACLHGVGDPGLVGLVSFVFTLCGT